MSEDPKASPPYIPVDTGTPSLLGSIPYKAPDPKEPPPPFERDLWLGRFMDAWSQLEASLRALLAVLSQAPTDSAFPIAAAIPDLGRMKELLETLGETYLADSDDQKELLEITKYLAISAQYRNSIVHGQWGLTSNRDKVATWGVVHDKMWIRIYTFIDKFKEFEAALGRDPQAEKRYVFTVPRLQERTQKARAFADRIDKFSERIQGRLRKPHGSVQHSLGNK
jgi:hypothetical protein